MDSAIQVCTPLGCFPTYYLQAAWAALVVGVGWAYAYHQLRLSRRERAANLFDSFYSADYYHAVVAPVYVINLKWQALANDTDREAYASALCKGWSTQESAAAVIRAYDPEHGAGAEALREEHFEQLHFRKARSIEEITDHSALTSFLYFWVKLEAMIEQKLVCKHLAVRLFARPYEFYAQFIADFRRAVRESAVTGDPDRPPSWVDATEHLEAMFAGKA